MINQKMFIFEFMSGGGYNQVDIPSSLFCEGYAMLRTIIEDFKKLGFQITTLLDIRIEFLSQYLKADKIKLINKNDDYIKKYTDCVKESSYCFIIAPEFSNILYNLTKIAKDNKKTVLSIDLEGIWLGTSKLKTYNFFLENKVNTPQTYAIPFKKKIDLEFILQKFDTLGSPVIIKPDDGVGSESIFYFETKAQIIHFFEDSNEKFDLSRNYILQEYIDGENLSVSIINGVSSKKPKAMNQIILSINAQIIKFKDSVSDSIYLGGFTPIVDYELLKDCLEKILKSMDLSSFRGYFGIDFIRKADNSIYFIEINPRLTTSYIGIRNILEYNPLEIIFNQDKLSLNLNRIPHQGFSKFNQLELKYVGDETPNKIIGTIIPKLMKMIPEIVTPPIALSKSVVDQDLMYYCFIATKTKDLDSSEKRISKIIRIFDDNNFKTIKYKVEG
jgi:predicted ATP-grasp superfamily ATP-dependent carboligase